MDLLNEALSIILNTEKRVKKECFVRASKLVGKVLGILNEKKYIGDFTEIKTQEGNWFKINLLGQINKCGVIKPRFSVKNDEYNKWEKRFLPGREAGLIIISTSQGLMTVEEAKNRKIGGRLIAYCY